MSRELEFGQMTIACTRGHQPELMKDAGYYALKEAGAPMTILAFACPTCHRRLFVTRELPHPDRETLNAIDTTP